jgi:hypothetical protein
MVVKPENLIGVHALDETYDLSGASDEAAAEQFVYLLVDLRFACDARGLDFAALDKQAYRHYVEEK